MGKAMDDLETLTAEDITFLEQKGISPQTIRQQLQRFREGFPRLEILRPATVNDGIHQLTHEAEEQYISLYETARLQGRTMKFVPASGAATRMFKDLIKIYHQLQQHQPLNEPDTQTLHRFIQNLPNFAFYEDIIRVLETNGYKLKELLQEKNYVPILHYLLLKDGLNYAELPKALLKFHRYPDHTRTPLEEHLVEGAQHVQSAEGVVRIHFTVPKKFRESIATYVQQVIPRYQQWASSFDISYSVQDPTTDTIAVDLNNQPIRDADGKLVFRPAGHGALLKNLNDLQGDIVFIKNIDNVVPDPRKPIVVRYKKVLGGLLVFLQQQVFQLLRELTQKPGQETVQKTQKLLAQYFNLPLPQSFNALSFNEQVDYLIQKLNRPIRVCGIVENKGEPGGGPFWIRDKDGEISLQIVESAQIDTNDPEQQRIWNASTHFNPTDIVCGVRDFQGKPFDLMAFRDNDAGIITIKYWQGQEIKVMELPGLWNGSMAKWLTVFVEVPLETFNPVKTVFDLLRPVHLPVTTQSMQQER